MELTDYPIEDLEYLLYAVRNSRDRNNARQEAAMIMFEHDIEQAIKDVKFDQETKGNLNF